MSKIVEMPQHDCSTHCFTCDDFNKKETIIIPLEEYKELLITKGKYEELKSDKSISTFPTYPNITYLNSEVFKYPYKITCEAKESE